MRAITAPSRRHRRLGARGRGIVLAVSAVVAALLAAVPAGADGHLWEVEVSGVGQAEGDSHNVFQFAVTVTRTPTNVSGESLTVSYWTPGGGTADAGTCGSAAADYAAIPESAKDTLTFDPPAGSQTRSAEVTVCGDRVDEQDETFIVSFSAPDARFTNGSQATGTVENDDDPVVSISVATADRPSTASAPRDVREGSAARDVTIHLDLDHASNEPLELTVDTVEGSGDGAATENEDYEPIVGETVQIGAGVHSGSAAEASLTLRILGDSFDELDEDVGLEFTVAGGNAVADPATLTIVNDDDPAFTVSDESIAEGAEDATSTMTFTVTLANDSRETVQLAWRTSSAGGEHDASPDGDYQAGNGSASIASGNRTATFSVTVNGDDAQEPDETFEVAVTRASTSPGDTTNDSATGIGTILNDDGVTPAISIADATAPEGAPGEITEIPVTVSLSNPTQEQVKVDYLTGDGTATSSTQDYEPLEGTLTFEPGEMEQTITVWVHGDEFPGPSEHFFVNLVTPVAATIADAQARITIENDDGPVIHVDDVEIVEPDTDETVMATLAFTLSETSPSEVTVDYETVDGTAEAVEDYTAQSGTVRIPAGGTSATVSIPIRGDDVTEEDESFTVELSEPAGGTPARSSITVTIIDDESGEPGAGSVLVQARDTDDSCPSGSVPEDGYADADGSVHEAAIDCLVWWQVTSGDGKGGYSPTQPVTRGQMATFIVRTLQKAGVTLPADPEDRFTDDDGDVHELSINQLADLGVVNGRADGTFGPTEEVSRAAMATFLAQAYETATEVALDSTTDHFDDDSGDTHEANINAVAEAGVAVGDGRGSYSPAASVRRDQMASFLVRLLDLLVEEEHAETPS